MAIQKFYFHNSEHDLINLPLDPIWGDDEEVSRIVASTTPLVGVATSLRKAVDEVSPSPISGIGIQGLTAPLNYDYVLTGQMRAAIGEVDAVFSTTEQAYLRLVIKLVSSDGSVVRGTLYNERSPVMVNSATNVAGVRLFSGNLTPTAAQVGDRLVFELGVDWFNTTSSNRSTSFMVYYSTVANPGEDYPFILDDPTTYRNSWIELDLADPPPTVEETPGRLSWNAPEERFFDAGLDRGVIYSTETGQATAWNGLISVDEEGAEGAVEYYIDGRPFLYLPKPKEFKASIRAYTFPDAFSEIMGLTEVADGLYLDSQQPQSFGLSYRTLVGNGLEGSDHGYKIHLVYNATAVPQSNSYESISDSINPTTFSWEVQAVPVKINGFRSTAHIIIDTRHMERSRVKLVEDLLYGTAASAAQLPNPQIIFDILNHGDAIVVTDLGDGNFEVSGSYENVRLLDPNTFQVDNVDAIHHGDGTFTISSTGI